MEISLAKPIQIQSVISFFNYHLNPDNPAIYSDEFLCPLGIKAAILRKQIGVAIVNNQIVGAFRFYPKKQKDTSLSTNLRLAKNTEVKVYLLRCCKQSIHHLLHRSAELIVV